MNFKKELKNNIEKYDCFTISDFSNPVKAQKKINKLIDQKILSESKIQGVYFKPKFSNLLNLGSTENVRSSVIALARKREGTICSDGLTCLNILHLSTQVPAKISYVSTGPDCVYFDGLVKIKNCKNNLLENHSELTNIVVQAIDCLLKSKKQLSKSEIKTLKHTLDHNLIAKINWRKLFVREMKNLPKNIQHEMLKLTKTKETK